MKRNTFLYITSLCLFLAYIFLLIEVMVFKNVPTIRIGQMMLNFGGTNADSPANFIPFSTILPYMFGNKGLLIAGINLAGNIILLVPLGFLFPVVFRTSTWKHALGLAVGSGLSVEILQTILQVGIFDIDDIILNALGVMIGYGVFRLLAQWIREKKYLHI